MGRVRCCSAPSSGLCEREHTQSTVQKLSNAGWALMGSLWCQISMTEIKDNCKKPESEYERRTASCSVTKAIQLYLHLL